MSTEKQYLRQLGGGSVPRTGIAVDGSHLMKSKVTEYRGVLLSTGEEIFRESVKYSSINVAEYLALVRGLQYIIENNVDERVLWSDSQTAIAWFHDRKSASSVSIPAMQKADIFLQFFEDEFETIEVKHWNKREIGIENPADFGRK